MATHVAPALANAKANDSLMPVPPPVTTTFFPATQSSGRVGEINGYDLECHIFVNDINLGITISCLLVIVPTATEDL